MRKMILAMATMYMVLLLFTFVFFRAGDIGPDPLVINPAVHYALTYPTPSQVTYVLATQLVGEFEAMSLAHRQQVNTTRWVLFFVLSGMFASGIFFALYFYRHYLAPFQQLKGFAADVAMGNLDMPLTIQRNNPFGAFTESFDMMRQELRLAKNREHHAHKAKYELVAKMSHDIRTPIASSLSTIDVMGLQPMAPFHQEKLESIAGRLGFMENLATNMFNATLEELAETKTVIQPMDTAALAEMIRQVDHQQQIEDFTLPGCIVDADRVKLYQVLNNIVSNAYKYAGTPITITGQINQGFLEMDIADQGPGVADFERHLIFNKFYRGEGDDLKEGYGLGLYIAKQFMVEMGGDMVAKPSETGLLLCVKWKLTTPTLQ